LAEDAPKRINRSVARTFTGLDDRDLDGDYETIFIFNTRSALQIEAADVLRSFGADKVMMLDGGGSTQLLCQGEPVIYSERAIPQAMGIMAGSAPASTPIPSATVGPPTETPPLSDVTPQVSAPTQPVSLLGETRASDVLWVLAVILPISLLLAVIVARINR
jgi:hypothetical protein